MSDYLQKLSPDTSLAALACLLAGLDGLPATAMAELAKRKDVFVLEPSDFTSCGFDAVQSQAIISLLHDTKQMQQLAADVSAALLQDPSQDPSQGQLQALSGVLAQRLADAPHPPVLVAANHNFCAETFAAPCVAIVGSRKASDRALRWTKNLAMSLAEAGIVIISGGAYGIDQAAHEGAIQAGGETLVVLGGTFAAEQKHLGKNFAPLWNQAQVMTEQVRHASIRSWMYPRRNRLVAAIASVVVVVEGGEKSGALITAGYAKKMGRSLMAVPGWVEDKMAQAPNALLHQQEALPCRHVDDVLQVLGRPVKRNENPGDAQSKKATMQAQDSAQGSLFSKPSTSTQSRPKRPVKTPLRKDVVTTSNVDDFAHRIQELNLSVLAQQVLTFLHTHPGACHVDDIATALDQSAAALAAVFLQLEIQNLIESLPGACFAYKK